MMVLQQYNDGITTDTDCGQSAEDRKDMENITGCNIVVERGMDTLNKAQGFKVII